MRCVAPRGAFYAMPQGRASAGKHRRGLRPRLAPRERHPLRVRLGLRHRPADGFFRIVFLASPAELGEIYDDIASFTREYLRT